MLQNRQKYLDFYNGYICMINEFGLFLTSSLSLSIYSDDKDIKIETVQKRYIQPKTHTFVYTTV